MAMKKSEKRVALTSFAKSILENPLHKNEFKLLLSRLNITTHEAIQNYLDYDMDLFSYGNEVYARKNIQLILHMHNYLEGSWHIDRHKTIYDFISYAKPETILDIGFGIPAKYIKDYIFKAPQTSVTLCDINEDTFNFASILLELWSKNYTKQINYKKLDMDEMKYAGDANLYLFQDSIEHTKDPAKYLKLHVDQSPNKAIFLLSIPIAPLIPMHYIAWEKVGEAKDWLHTCGLKIIKEKIIHTNKMVDLFSDDLDFSNLIVLCTKMSEKR